VKDSHVGEMTRRSVWRRRLAALCAAALPLSGLAVVLAQPASAAAVTLPDMQLLVPTADISIGTDGGTGLRQLQFEHISWDAGKGPFEIAPTPVGGGMATFVQAIYRSPRPGVWKFDHSVPLGYTGAFEPPSDYRFPLDSFTLNKVTASGGVGAVVAKSPKIDYCMTGDTRVGGVPNTPDTTFIPQSNCTDPAAPLGWSVGWGDEYDQTDNGQPIDLPNHLNGTFILQGSTDPLHLLTESNPDNNVVDTKLAIHGYSVTVLSQTRPGVRPPRVSLTSPKNGSTVKGSVTLGASASARAPAKVSSVQFLLDGEPLGRPDKRAPYRYTWHIGSTPPGRHALSARVTDSLGGSATAPVRTVTVVSGNPNRLGIDASVTRTGTGTLVAPRLSTSHPGETLLAFAGSDGPAGAARQSVTVRGGGLAWKLVRRANGRSGDAEIWTAHAAGRLRNAKITATPRAAGYALQLTVLAFRHSAGVGASAVASAASGAPRITLTTKAAGSLSYAVGADYDNAIARTVGARQVLISQWVDTAAGDTFWVQGRTRPSPGAHQKVTLNDTAPTTDQWNLAAVEVKPGPAVRPAASLVNPAPRQIVSGTIPVAADASAGVAISAVRFFLDGRPLGRAVTAPPYAIRWNTRTARAGTHVLSARVTDIWDRTGTAASVPVTVRNPRPQMTCFVMQDQQSVHGRGTVTTRSFHTAAGPGGGGEVLLAFVSSAGPAGPHRQAVTVSGAGLTWTLVRRANARSGDAEIWQATARQVITDVRVTSTPARPGYYQELTVIAMEGTDGAGVSAAASGASGAPALRLTTTRPTSLIFAVGTGRDGAAARVLPIGWVPLSQWRHFAAGVTDWSQYTNQPVGRTGTTVRVASTSPAAGDWNFAAVAVPGDDG